MWVCRWRGSEGSLSSSDDWGVYVAVAVIVVVDDASRSPV